MGIFTKKPTQEQINYFCLDYITYMPEITGKSKAAIHRAAELYANHLQLVKTNPPVLKLLLCNLEQFEEYAPPSSIKENKRVIKYFKALLYKHLSETIETF